MTDVSVELTISAALDGEAVDLDALRAALRTDEGRQVLASYALIRAGAAAGDIEPDAQYARHLRASLAARRRSWFVAGPAVPLRLAASLAAVAVGAALWAGVVSRPRGSAAPVAAPVASVATAPSERSGPPEQAAAKTTAETAVPLEQRGDGVRRARSAVLDETPPTPTRTIPLVPVESGS